MKEDRKAEIRDILRTHINALGGEIYYIAASDLLEDNDLLEEKNKELQSIIDTWGTPPQPGRTGVTDHTSPDTSEEKRPKCPIEECDGGEHPFDWANVSCREYFDCWYDKTEQEKDPKEPEEIEMIDGYKALAFECPKCGKKAKVRDIGRPMVVRCNCCDGEVEYPYEKVDIHEDLYQAQERIRDQIEKDDKGEKDQNS